MRFPIRVLVIVLKAARILLPALLTASGSKILHRLDPCASSEILFSFSGTAWFPFRLRFPVPPARRRPRPELDLRDIFPGLTRFSWLPASLALYIITSRVMDFVSGVINPAQLVEVQRGFRLSAPPASELRERLTRQLTPGAFSPRSVRSAPSLSSVAPN